MRLKVLFAILLFAGVALAKDPPSYQKGILQLMESVPCGYNEKSGKGIGGALLGTDSENKKTREMLCPEYILETDRIIYRIRPREEKQPVLLPVGEVAEFRIRKDKMLLRVPELDGKEREYTVVSMTPRADAKDARLTGKGAPK